MKADNLKTLYITIAVVITAIAFLPSLFNGFVDLDDTSYVVNNELIKNFSFEKAGKIFTRAFVGCYCPLAVISYIPEYHLFKLNPFAYHLTNYLLHLAVTILVFCLIYLLLENMEAAFISAILFGIHPLHVESVAWISERKDLLCAIFYIAALISYLGYIRHKKPAYYLSLFGYSLLAFLSKPMAVTIPFILVLLDYLAARRVTFRSILEKLPFFILSLVFGFINLHFQSSVGATALKATFGVKLYFLSKAIPFYLSKIILPVNLSVMYLYHDVSPGQISEIKYYVGISIVLFILVIFSATYSRKIIFGSTFFFITLLPVLKIIPAGDSFAADRYMYLPSIGIFYIFSVFITRLLNNRIAIIKFSAIALISLAVVSLSVLARNRCLVWKDTESLYMDILKKYPTRPPIYNDLGAFFAEKGDYAKAIKCFHVALALDKNYAGAKDNLTRALSGKRLKEIRDKGGDYLNAQLEKAKDVTEKVKLLNRMGLAEGQAHNLDKAVELFKEAIGLDPDYAESYHNLGYAYYIKGEVKTAEEYFKKTLELDPSHKNARMNLDFIRENRGTDGMERRH